MQVLSTRLPKYSSSMSFPLLFPRETASPSGQKRSHSNFFSQERLKNYFSKSCTFFISFWS